MHPASGLCVWWGGFTLLGIVLSMALGSPELGFLFRLYLEIFLPILFYDWMLALTAPDAAGRSVAAMVFRSRPFAFLADISMSVYLIHMPVISVISFIFGSGPSSMPWWGTFVALPVTLLLGWALTRLVEQPLKGAIRGDKTAYKGGGMELTPAVVGTPVQVGLTPANEASGEA